MKENIMINIVDLNKVYDPGFHCAFTDITFWRGRVWLTFREALNHSSHPSSQIVIMSSANHGRSFQVESRISKRNHDVRDPHFLINNDRLHVIIPTWDMTQLENHRKTLFAVSDNGHEFDFIDDINAFDFRTVWRPRISSKEKVWYVTAYEPNKVHLLRSEDGIEWQEVSIIHVQDLPSETELCFLPDGDLIALVRRGAVRITGCKPILARSTFPYKKWDKIECDQFLEGPLLERLGEDNFLVVGRSPQDLNNPECERRVTRLFSLDIDTGHLEPYTALISGNDTSYAGFVILPKDSASNNNGDANALLSYYSGHEYDNGDFRGSEQWQRSAIYVARVVV
jgi:hypothetical protein